MQVCTVTLICTICFFVRAVFIALATVDAEDFSINVLDHPLLNVIFYSSVELVPAALVLYTLRKLPPKQTVTHPPTIITTQQDLESAMQPGGRPAAGM
jgi:hypothetical protein